MSGPGAHEAAGGFDGFDGGEVGAVGSPDATDTGAWRDDSVLEPLETATGLPSNPEELVSDTSGERLKRDLAVLARHRRMGLLAIHPRHGFSGVLIPTETAIDE